MRYRAVHHGSGGKINVTPLIDVVMCLIVFYLMVGKMASDRVAKVELPESRRGVAESSRGGLVVNVLAGEGNVGVRMVVDGAQVDEASLARMLASLSSNDDVTIRADRSLSYEPVGKIVNLCRDAGLKSVKLAAQRGGGSN